MDKFLLHPTSLTMLFDLIDLLGVPFLVLIHDLMLV